MIRTVISREDSDGGEFSVVYGVGAAPFGRIVASLRAGWLARECGSVVRAYEEGG